VPRAYQALTSQQHRAPRSKDARKRHAQFLSAAKRTFAGDATLDTPGPGAYDGYAHERPRGFASVRDSRFRFESSKVPGPSDYEVRHSDDDDLFTDFLSLSLLRVSYHRCFKTPFFVEHSIQL
jgi:hypothetical protein